MLIKLMILAAAAAAATSAATATGVRAAEEANKELSAHLPNDGKPRRRAAHMDDPSAQTYGMEYMYI